ncbi:MAG: HAD-IB family phosphatase [Gemmatimonadaceae bacterium]|nr:HAD-IB family phosphatase [Gemmatimonadaceae bacterium]
MFASVVCDADSTLAGVEGIDWLAGRRGAAVAAAVAELTDDAMAGRVALDAVYGERLARIRPTRADIAALGDAYVAALAPGAIATVHALSAAGVRVVIVSGGLRPALLPMTRALGIAERDLHAVDLVLDAHGAYEDFDRASPLATQGGKPRVLAALSLPAPVLAVGDGSTDVAMREAGATFAAFTGFVHRASVVAQAAVVLQDFDALRALVLPSLRTP